MKKNEYLSIIFIVLAFISFSCKKNTNEWPNYTTKNGLVNNEVTAIAIDSMGNKWIGTNFGLSKFDGSQWTTYKTNNGLANNEIEVIVTEGKNNIWVGTMGGLSMYNGSTWTNYHKVNGLAGDTIFSICVDKQRNKWFAYSSYFLFDSKGVTKFDGKTWTTYTSSNGLVNDSVNAITVDGQGNLWFGTNNGLSEFDGTHWTTFLNNQGWSNNYVKALAIDNQGNKWSLNNIGEVIKFNGENWSKYMLKVTGPGLNCIGIDYKNAILVGTYSNGIFEYDGNLWKNYSVSEGLESNTIFSIAIDTNNIKWLGTNSGVVLMQN